MNQLSVFKRSRFLFLIGYVLVLIRSFIYTTTLGAVAPEIIGQILRVIAYMFFLMQVVSEKKFKVNNFLIFIAIIGVAFITRVSSSYSVVIDYAICSIASINTDFKKIVKTYAITASILTLITILLSLMGFITNYTYLRYDTGVIRLSMGFVYPTDFAAHIYFISCATMYLIFEKLKLRHGVFFITISYVTYLVTNARGPCLMILLTFGICYLCKLYEEKGIKIIPKWLLEYSFVFCSIVTFILLNSYNPRNDLWVQIDKLSSWRLSLGVRLMKENTITLFGKYVMQRGNGYGNVALGDAYTYIDISYMRILIMYGILMFAGVMLYSIAINVRSLKKNNYIISYLLLAVSLYSITAQHYFDFSYDFLLLAFFATLEDKEIVKEHHLLRIKIKGFN